jgi:phosphatidylglycerol---prolipoprotein diacylglyceryl transferase
MKKYRGVFSFLLFLLLVISFVLFQLRNPNGVHAFYNILGIRINLYGLFIALAVLVCMVGFSFLKSKEFDTLNVIEACVWVLIPAIVLARGWHVVSDYSAYDGHLSDLFNISSGGMSIWGGVIGGLAGACLFCNTHGFDINLGINLLAVILPLGQMTGRLGNLVNQELFGPPTDKPWGMYVRLANRPREYIRSEYFHSAFLYEMLGSFILFCFLLALYKFLIKKFPKLLKKSFFVGAIYLIGYGIIRFVVEFYRLEKDFHLGISLNQFLALGFVAVGSTYLFLLFIKTRYDKKN